MSSTRKHLARTRHDGTLLTIICTIALGLLGGCQPGNTASTNAGDEELEKQRKQYQRQLNDADRQIKDLDEYLNHQVRQTNGFDKLLKKQEEQAERYDRILDAMERQYEVERKTEPEGKPAP